MCGTGFGGWSVRRWGSLSDVPGGIFSRLHDNTFLVFHFILSAEMEKIKKIYTQKRAMKSNSLSKINQTNSSTSLPVIVNKITTQSISYACKFLSTCFDLIQRQIYCWRRSNYVERKLQVYFVRPSPGSLCLKHAGARVCTIELVAHKFSLKSLKVLRHCPEMARRNIGKILCCDKKSKKICLLKNC